LIGVVLQYCEIAPQITIRAPRASAARARRVEDVATYIVEINVNAFRAILL